MCVYIYTHTYIHIAIEAPLGEEEARGRVQDVDLSRVRD